MGNRFTLKSNRTTIGQPYGVGLFFCAGTGLKQGWNRKRLFGMLRKESTMPKGMVEEVIQNFLINHEKRYPEVTYIN
ncbi:hypothetical protein J2TS4_15320 [Paenibacillus sp. J2TS4]|nr:hypothetical protein J2TS4_15320 [Paenibacillus sp. J2TS4]